MNEKLVKIFLIFLMFPIMSWGQKDSELVSADTRDARCSFEIKKVKFKSRNSLFAKVVNDFDKQESSGYYLIITADFISHSQKSITLHNKDLVVEDINGYQYNIDTEYDDVARIAGGADFVSCSPNMPVKLKITFDVPSKQHYTLKLK